ncbi:hypothetical protein B1218_36060, partial [Pseudomonas ogarae]
GGWGGAEGEGGKGRGRTLVRRAGDGKVVGLQWVGEGVEEDGRDGEGGREAECEADIGAGGGADVEPEKAVERRLAGSGWGVRGGEGCGGRGWCTAGGPGSLPLRSRSAARSRGSFRISPWRCSGPARVPGSSPSQYAGLMADSCSG